jgi:hypothetical protein
MKTPKKRKPKPLWASRDPGHETVEFWAKKPVLLQGYYRPNGSDLDACLCCSDLLKYTGLKVKPGTCVKVQFSVEVIG